MTSHPSPDFSGHMPTFYRCGYCDDLVMGGNMETHNCWGVQLVKRVEALEKLAGIEDKHE
jgi:hypothetical protein